MPTPSESAVPPTEQSLGKIARAMLGYGVGPPHFGEIPASLTGITIPVLLTPSQDAQSVGSGISVAYGTHSHRQADFCGLERRILSRL